MRATDAELALSPLACLVVFTQSWDEVWFRKVLSFAQCNHHGLILHRYRAEEEGAGSTEVAYCTLRGVLEILKDAYGAFKMPAPEKGLTWHTLWKGILSCVFLRIVWVKFRVGGPGAIQALLWAVVCL